MSALSFGGDYIAISSIEKTLVFNQKDFSYKLLDNLSDVDVKDDVTDGYVPSLCSQFSPNGNHLIICSRKSMSLWNKNDWSVERKLLNRAANSVKFINDYEILVANKTGDVWFYNLKHFETPGNVLLGHVSMLLDLLISPDGKFVITCDRDEKIRVTRYPETFCIESFCLGHTEFISSLSFLPNKTDVLVSAGGDGTLKFWSYINGTQLNSRDVSQDFIQKTRQANVITQIKCCLSDQDTLIFCVFNSINAVLVYLVNSNLECIPKEIIELQSNPINIGIANGLLWILTNINENRLLLYNISLLEQHNNELVDKINSCLEKYKLFNNLIDSEKLVNSFYKRKYDNVYEYMQRKTQRLDEQAKKKICVG